MTTKAKKPRKSAAAKPETAAISALVPAAKAAEPNPAAKAAEPNQAIQAAEAKHAAPPAKPKEAAPAASKPAVPIEVLKAARETLAMAREIATSAVAIAKPAAPATPPAQARPKLQIAPAPALPEFQPLPLPEYDELAALNRQNFLAAAKTGAALTDAMEAIGREFLSFARFSMQNAAKTAEQLMMAKTLQDVIHVNTEFAMTSVKTLADRSAQMSRAGAELAHKSLDPWRGQVEANLTTLIKPIIAKPPVN